MLFAEVTIESEVISAQFYTVLHRIKKFGDEPVHPFADYAHARYREVAQAMFENIQYLDDSASVAITLYVLTPSAIKVVILAVR